MHNNIDIMNSDISIEEFAAFLDGNLAEEDMLHVSMAIDGSPEYSGILGDVMHIDEAVDAFIHQQPDGWQQDVMDMDFDLPVVPVMAETADVVELAAAHPLETDTVEVHQEDDDVHLSMASDADEDPSDAHPAHPTDVSGDEVLAAVHHPCPSDITDLDDPMGTDHSDAPTDFDELS